MTRLVNLLILIILNVYSFSSKTLQSAHKWKLFNSEIFNMISIIKIIPVVKCKIDHNTKYPRYQCCNNAQVYFPSIIIIMFNMEH